MMKVVLSFFLSGICVVSLWCIPLVSAQTASSECIVTKVGTPLGEPPALPATCTVSGGGVYHFMFSSADEILGISTEMASYAGTYSWGGHKEHAGLDLMTTYGARVPLFATTAGRVIESGSNCVNIEAGCRVAIEHSSDSLVSIYTHVDPSVSLNQTITEGQQIGVVHKWQNTPGMDHLHFELREQGSRYNVNPRNHFPELQRFPVDSGYEGGIRVHSSRRGVYLEEDGKEFAEHFKYHPPCTWAPGTCWAQ